MKQFISCIFKILLILKLHKTFIAFWMDIYKMFVLPFGYSLHWHPARVPRRPRRLVVHHGRPADLVLVLRVTC